MRPSRRAKTIAESETLRLFTEMARLRRRGREIVSLLEGEADLPAPKEVEAATIRALRAGQTRYSGSSGLPELRAAIARKLKRENGVSCAPENILIANGAKQALYETLQALCDPGDEVVIPSPYWVTFPEAARLAGAKPVLVETVGQHLDVDALGRAITRRTRAIILNTPNNPTGAVYAAPELREMAKLARRRNLFMIADEAYERFVYDGRAHVSAASLSRDAARRTVTIQTFSKSCSMTGFRVGYLAADAAIARAIARLHGHMTGNVCTFAQHGALAALKLPARFHEKQRLVFQGKRDLAFASATRLFDCLKPRGGFFVWADARRHLGRRFKTTVALAQHLLRSGVAVVPGSSCGREGWLRLSFSGSEENIRMGFALIEKALCP